MFSSDKLILSFEDDLSSCKLIIQSVASMRDSIMKCLKWLSEQPFWNVPNVLTESWYIGHYCEWWEGKMASKGHDVSAAVSLRIATLCFETKPPYCSRLERDDSFHRVPVTACKGKFHLRLLKLLRCCANISVMIFYTPKGWNVIRVASHFRCFVEFLCGNLRFLVGTTISSILEIISISFLWAYCAECM
jgi:hypothetical protein